MSGRMVQHRCVVVVAALEQCQNRCCQCEICTYTGLTLLFIGVPACKRVLTKRVFAIGRLARERPWGALVDRTALL